MPPAYNMTCYTVHQVQAQIDPRGRCVKALASNHVTHQLDTQHKVAMSVNPLCVLPQQRCRNWQCSQLTLTCGNVFWNSLWAMAALWPASRRSEVPCRPSVAAEMSAAPPNPGTRSSSRSPFVMYLQVMQQHASTALNDCCPRTPRRGCQLLQLTDVRSKRHTALVNLEH